MVEKQAVTVKGDYDLKAMIVALIRFKRGRPVTAFEIGEMLVAVLDARAGSACGEFWQNWKQLDL